jgi:hypothetical protein
MANSDRALETGVRWSEGYALRAVGSGVPLAAAVYVASGSLWIGVAVAFLVAIAGAFVRRFRKTHGRRSASLTE